MRRDSGEPIVSGSQPPGLEDLKDEEGILKELGGLEEWQDRSSLCSSSRKKAPPGHQLSRELWRTQENKAESCPVGGSVSRWGERGGGQETPFRDLESSSAPSSYFPKAYLGCPLGQTCSSPTLPKPGVGTVFLLGCSSFFPQDS